MELDASFTKIFNGCPIALTKPDAPQQVTPHEVAVARIIMFTRYIMSFAIARCALKNNFLKWTGLDQSRNLYKSLSAIRNFFP